jgi:DNA-binding NarL/FixJ family response regulator
MNPITVLLGEDHTIVREGLRKMLELEGGFEIIGEAQDGRQAVAQAQKLQPDVVLMDIAMPLLNGLEALRQIIHVRPTAKVLMLSAHSDDAYVKNAVESGASGFLLKQTSSHDVCRAIREIHAGKTCFTAAVAKRLNHHRLKSRSRGELYSKKDADILSSREMEVLQLIAEGKANKESAEVLHISVKTVEKHRQSLMDKLNIHDTAGLTRHAIATGIIESSVQVTIV